MPDTKTTQRLRGLVLSASELKTMTQWPDALVEDYLNLLDNFITIANLLDIELDQKLEEVPTLFLNGSVPYVKDGFLAEDNTRLFWDATNFILRISGIIASEGRLKGKVRLTIADSPHNIQISEENIFADTDDGPIVLNLPAGSDGEQHKITNVGSSNNDVTLNPNDLELLNGFNASEAIRDSETFDVGYDDIEGWWA
jgi:hypothetical protein